MIQTEYSHLTFGEYKGHTLPWLLFHDPDYFFWAYEKAGLLVGPLREDADFLYPRATHIKVPQKDGQVYVAEHLFDQNGKYARLRVVPKDEFIEAHGMRSPVIDLSVAHRRNKYDKLGYKLMLPSLKFYLFGPETISMTERRCQEFYSNDAYFELGSS